MDATVITAEDIFEIIVENAQAEADALRALDFAEASLTGGIAYRLMVRYAAMTGLDVQTVRRLVDSDLA
jgi:hypothetical protein